MNNKVVAMETINIKSLLTKDTANTKLIANLIAYLPALVATSIYLYNNSEFVENNTLDATLKTIILLISFSLINKIRNYLDDGTRDAKTTWALPEALINGIPVAILARNLESNTIKNLLGIGAFGYSFAYNILLIREFVEDMLSLDTELTTLNGTPKDIADSLISKIRSIDKGIWVKTKDATCELGQDNMYESTAEEGYWTNEDSPTYIYDYNKAATLLNKLPKSIRAKIIEALPAEHKKHLQYTTPTHFGSDKPIHKYVVRPHCVTYEIMGNHGPEEHTVSEGETIPEGAIIKDNINQ
jgi:hypothetical protein